MKPYLFIYLYFTTSVFQKPFTKSAKGRFHEVLILKNPLFKGLKIFEKSWYGKIEGEFHKVGFAIFFATFSRSFWDAPMASR